MKFGSGSSGPEVPIGLLQGLDEEAATELLSRAERRSFRADEVLFAEGRPAFSEDAYQRAAEPKELVIIPGAGHVDLDDRVNLMPFDKLTEFFRGNLS
jgi:fermentation-respiration switch protein FrsA (DUF1100 family)